MKRIIKIFFIAYLFFASLCVNAMDLSINLAHQTNTIQSLDNKKSIYSVQTDSEKFIVQSNNFETSVLFQKKDNSELNFKDFKNGITPTSYQFAQLVSYVYNKSFLREYADSSERAFLTEISPNAP